MKNQDKKRKNIRKYIEYYTESKEAREIIKCSKIINEEGFDVWSFKKLILLEYYIKPYLNILLNQECKCVFIDLFSSSGVNKVKGKDLVSIGSPIISLLRGVYYIKSKDKINRFDKWFFIEKEEQYCKALKIRIKKVLDILDKEYEEKLKINKDVNIVCGDCNKKIIDIIDKIKKEYENDKLAVLVFIDPYKFTDIEWETWEKILSLIYVDIIFTFPIYSIRRGVSQCKNKEKYLPPSLIDLCKNKSPSQIEENQFEELYAKDIVNLVKRKIHYYDGGVKVKNTRGGEIYRIELFTHSEPASNLTLKIANSLEKVKALDLREIADQIQGKSKSLRDWMNGKT